MSEKTPYPPRFVVQPKPRTGAPPPYRPFAQPKVAQPKVTQPKLPNHKFVRVVQPGSRAPNALHRVVQPKYANQVPDTPNVPSVVLQELEKMMAAAHIQKGQASPQSPVMTTLGKLDSEFQKTVKVDSQNTFGVGGSSFFPGVSTFVSVGSGAYQNSIKASSTGEPAKGFGTSEPINIGSRPSCTHGEVAIISEYPGVQGIVTTQNACIFCYGLLCSRGYQHQALRENPWPQKWTHDWMGFKLHLLGNNNSTKQPVVEIIWGEDYRWYWVERL